jgi:hypothetical protein
VYLVHRSGSVVRYVYGPADVFFPTQASFSPDGRFIAAVDARRQLIVVNLTTLEVRHPISTLADVYSTDWSPDGHTILYSLFYSGNPATTLDSLGLFLYDVASGTSRPLRWGSNPVFSFYPRWSPDGSRIAMDEWVGPATALSVMNANGSTHDFLVPPQSHDLGRVEWYQPQWGGVPRVLFFNSAPNFGPYLINPDGTGLTPFWHTVEFERCLSPTGLEYVRGGLDPSSRFLVLYVGPVADKTDAALRQVTKYTPALLAARDR